MSAPRIGMVHIPKTAGSALRQALAPASRTPHLRRLLPPGSATADPSGRTLVDGSPEFDRARREPWLSGHVSAAAMRRLDRDFVFSVWRDRRMRLISLYRFRRWQWEHGNQAGGLPPDQSLVDWLLGDDLELSGRAWAGLGGPGLLVAAPHSLPEDDAADPERARALRSPLPDADEVRRRLALLDVVFFPRSPQEVVDDLASRGLVERVAVPIVRATATASYPVVDADDALAAFERPTWERRVHDLVLHAARERFGHPGASEAASDGDVVAELRRTGICGPPSR